MERYTELFLLYIRGQLGSVDLRTAETEAFGTTAEPDGGYRVPTALQTMMVDHARERLDAKRRTEDSVELLSDFDRSTFELYAMPAATQTLLEDEAVNLFLWLAEEAQDPFAEQSLSAAASGYLFPSDQPIRILRDPYTAKPYVLFYTTQRLLKTTTPRTTPQPDPVKEELVEALESIRDRLVAREMEEVSERSIGFNMGLKAAKQNVDAALSKAKEGR